MDRNNQSSISKGIILIFWAAMSFGCNSLNNNYGLGFNHEREKLGIPLLPDDWSVHENFYNKENITWRNSDEDCHNCYHKKVVIVEKGSIKLDYTEFVSNITYPVDDSHAYAYIGFRLCFSEDDTICKKGMTCLYYHDSITHYFPKEITRGQADSIINIWKKNRVSYRD